MHDALGVLVTCERRFKKTPDGVVWTTSTDDCSFWRRYLGPFNGVRVLSRVEGVQGSHPSWKAVSGPGVEVVPIPCFVGPSQFLLHYPAIRRLCKQALRGIQAVILRTPGNVALAMQAALKRDGRPYGVEVTGDPDECYAPGAIEHPLRPVFRVIFTTLLRRQCAGAATAAYVTRVSLQRKFPPAAGTWATHYSSVSLPGEAFALEPRNQPAGNGQLKLVSVGSMEQPYKGFDTLIHAVHICMDRGLDLQLTLVGTGKHRARLEALAVGQAVPVRFTGELPGPAAVRGEVSRADLFVLPSWTEGLPRVMIEAMAQALPCIGTAVGGTAELLEPSEIVQPGDAEALAALISQVASDVPLQRKMSSRNLEKAREYADAVLSTRREAMYTRLREFTLDHFTGVHKPTRPKARHFVLAREILGLRTNVTGFSWPFGMNAPETSSQHYEQCKCRVSLIARPRGWLESRVEAVNHSPMAGKYHYFSGLPRGDEVVYHRRLFPGCHIYLRASGLTSDSPLVEVNSLYLRLVHYRFMNLHSAAYVLADLAALLLLRLGFAPAHCSCVKMGDRVVVVFAPSNTGKTLTAMTLCRHYAAEFLAEDLAITDGSVVHAVPWTSTFRFYADTSARRGLRWRRRLEQVFPIIELLPSTLWQRVTDILDESKIAASGVVTDVVVLERGPDGVESASVEMITPRIVNLNRAEFNYMRALLNNAYSYFNPWLDMQAAAAREIEILGRLAANAQNRWLVRARRPDLFAGLITRALQPGSEDSMQTTKG